MGSSKKLIALWTFVAAGLCALQAGAVTYHLTDIGTLGGNSSYAEAINSSGQVAGYSFATSPSTAHAFLYASGTLTDVGQPYGGDTEAFNINNAGQIVGEGASASGVIEHGYIYTAGTFTDLLPFGIYRADSINSSGQVAGTTTNIQAVIYANGSVTQLGTLGGSTSTAHAINDSGNVVGEADTGSVDIFGTPVSHAFLYSNGVMKDLGSLGGTYCSAGAISPDASVITGTGWTVPYQPGGPNTHHAFVYTNSIMRDLGTFGGANSGGGGVNSRGQFVGYAETAGGAAHAFLYQNNAMIDLNNLIDSSGIGWTISIGSGINDNGWVAAWAVNPSGHTHGVLLTPTPEPGCCALLVIFASFVRSRGCRRK